MNRIAEEKREVVKTGENEGQEKRRGEVTMRVRSRGEKHELEEDSTALCNAV